MTARMRKPGWRLLGRAEPSWARVAVASDPGLIDEFLLAEIAHIALERETSLLGLATGATFEDFFRLFVERARERRLPVHNLVLTHLDEYIGGHSGLKGSMSHELDHHLLEPMGALAPRLLRVPSSESEGLEEGHLRNIAELGGLRLQLLGLGRNGHIAFNEPGTPFERSMHRVSLTPSTIEANSGRFRRDQGMPGEARTLGPLDILGAKSLRLVARGKKKAEAVRQLLMEPVSPQCPASLLRLHPEAMILLDEDAAGALPADGVPRLSELENPEPHEGGILVLAPDLVSAIEYAGPSVIYHPDPERRCQILLTSNPPRVPPALTHRLQAKVSSYPADHPRLVEEIAERTKADGLRIVFVADPRAESPLLHFAAREAVLAGRREGLELWQATSDPDHHPLEHDAGGFADAISALEALDEPTAAERVRTRASVRETLHVRRSV